MNSSVSWCFLAHGLYCAQFQKIILLQAESRCLILLFRSFFLASACFLPYVYSLFFLLLLFFTSCQSCMSSVTDHQWSSQFWDLLFANYARMQGLCCYPRFKLHLASITLFHIEDSHNELKDRTTTLLNQHSMVHMSDMCCYQNARMKSKPYIPRK